MAHLLGTPSNIPDALPRELTEEELWIKKMQEREWQRKYTAPTPTADCSYSQVQNSAILYKKVDFAPTPMAEVSYSQHRYAPNYYPNSPTL